MSIPQKLQEEIEVAYDYRGYVTITLKNKDNVEAFVFNREFANPKLKEDYFIEAFLKSGEKKQISMKEIESVQITGEDFAAGKSYEDHLKKQNPTAK